MSRSFADLGLPSPIVETLTQSGIDAPFPIQAAAIPDVLAGRDVAARAPTGSGKTLAFGLPMLALTPSAAPRRPTALILTPTRELAAQIRKELAPYGKATRRQVFAVFGGVRYGAQIEWLDRGVDILVATPGRLEDLMEQGIVDLGSVGIVTVDEADRMADMGFLPAVRRIIDATSANRQTLLFSATLDGDVAVLIRAYQTDPVRHESGGVESHATEATHLFWDVERTEKVHHTAEAIRAGGSTIVFTRTRHGADRLARQLDKQGVSAIAMHGGRSQNQRNRALADFAKGSVEALVATDVAARGIHVDDVATVVHYDPPNGHKDYLHRSGRTARAGASGTVVSLVMQPERRAVNRMKKELDIDAPTAAPRHDTVRGGVRRPAVGSTAKAPDTSRQRKHRSEGRTPRDQPAPTRTTSHDRTGTAIMVRNLPWAATEADLRKLFGRYGTVADATVKVDRRGRSKGIAVVRMDPESASRAIPALDGRKVKGRPIQVAPGR
jgi:superfamily II DNA/RNA helicase